MIAVITGDIVNSTKMQSEAYHEATSILQSQINEAKSFYNAKGEIYRGDAFQLQYPQPLDALTDAILIKLKFYVSGITTKPTQLTMSLAYGEYQMYADKPNTSIGPVYIASGRGLEKTIRGDLSVWLPQPLQCNNIVLLTQYLNHQLNRLTTSQAELLYLYIKNDFIEHQKLADLTNTSRQNISNRLSAIGATLVGDYIKIVNSYVEQQTLG